MKTQIRSNSTTIDPNHVKTFAIHKLTVALRLLEKAYERSRSIYLKIWLRENLIEPLEGLIDYMESTKSENIEWEWIILGNDDECIPEMMWKINEMLRKLPKFWTLRQVKKILYEVYDRIFELCNERNKDEKIELDYEDIYYYSMLDII